MLTLTEELDSKRRSNPRVRTSPQGGEEAVGTALSWEKAGNRGDSRLAHAHTLWHGGRGVGGEALVVAEL